MHPMQVESNLHCPPRKICNPDWRTWRNKCLPFYQVSGFGIHHTHLDNNTAAGSNTNLALSYEKHDSSVELASNSGSLSKGADILTPEPLYLQTTKEGQVNYIDSSHWQSILEDIKEVRDHLSVLNNSTLQSESISEKNHANPDPSLIFGSVPTIDLSDILSSLPPQPIREMLLSWYFNSRFMILGKTNIPAMRY
jgi:hypothetical protein